MLGMSNDILQYIACIREIVCRHGQSDYLEKIDGQEYTVSRFCGVDVLMSDIGHFKIVAQDFEVKISEDGHENNKHNRFLNSGFIEFFKGDTSSLAACCDQLIHLNKCFCDNKEKFLCLSH